MSEAETKNKIKILLIEDDQFLAKMYQTKLSLEDFIVVSAIDGEKGLEFVKKENPDIILLDIILPKMDGWQVLDSLKNKSNNGKRIPVILLTNLGQKEDIEKGLSLGADDYLIKAHFTPHEVVEKIKEVLDKQKK